MTQCTPALATSGCVNAACDGGELQSADAQGLLSHNTPQPRDNVLGECQDDSTNHAARSIKTRQPLCRSSSTPLPPTLPSNRHNHGPLSVLAPPCTVADHHPLRPLSATVPPARTARPARPARAARPRAAARPRTRCVVVQPHHHQRGADRAFGLRLALEPTASALRATAAAAPARRATSRANASAERVLYNPPYALSSTPPLCFVVVCKNTARLFAITK